VDGVVETVKSISDSGQLGAVGMAIAIVVATAILAGMLTHLIRRLMDRDGTPLPSSSIIVNVGRCVVWALGLSFMLSACFGVDVNALVTALGIGGIALSLGLQDTIKNFIGGMQVTLMGIVHPGDHVIVGGVEGIVQDVSWRQTVLKDIDTNIHLIPNATINSTTVTKIEPENLVVATLSFTNDCRDLDRLIPVMEREAKAAIEKVAELERDPWILLSQIGEYGTWAKIRFVLKDLSNARAARDAALRAVAPYARNNAKDVISKAEEPFELNA